MIEVPAVSAFCMSFVGEVAGPAEEPRIQDADARRRADREEAAAAWRELSRALSLSGPREITAIDESLPWFGMNALIHYLTPYGLEQFSGAAWGTRDVCQGPIDLLLCQERYAEAKQVLRILFSRQDPDGGWPQWWMFDSYASVRADGAHGDVIYWCILALCSYLKTSGDFAFLDERLPFFARVPEGALRHSSADDAEPALRRTSSSSTSTASPASFTLVRPRYRVGSVRRRRLERLATACQRGARAPHGLELDGADVLPGLRRVIARHASARAGRTKRAS